MRIEGTGRSAKTGASGKARRSGGSGEAFVIEAAEQSPGSAATASAANVSGVETLDAILALQSVDDSLHAKRKAVARGHALVDALEDLKADLLAGRVDAAVLNRMSVLVRQNKGHDDPQLDALVADVELRVRVELAKFGRYPD